MANRITEYEVNGHLFKLRPNTRKLGRQLGEYMERYQADLHKISEVLAAKVDGKDVSEMDIPEIPDQYQISFDVFCMITEGPHEKLDSDEFDIHVAEVAIESFMPSKNTRI